MVEVQIAARGVRNRYVLEAMRRVPRDVFVEPGFEEFAYEDGALPIAEGQAAEAAKAADPELRQRWQKLAELWWGLLVKGARRSKI
jgi:protein-L-isoaspartate O-methyltransferase